MTRRKFLETAPIAAATVSVVGNKTFGQSNPTANNTHANSPLDPEIINKVRTFITENYASAYQNFKRLDAVPEILFDLPKTAKIVQENLQSIPGVEIHEGLAPCSFVAVLKNGTGKTVGYRTDLDGLKVETTRQDSWLGNKKSYPNSHSCGHSTHCQLALSICKFFAENKSLWSGTAIFLFQSSEEGGNPELGSGAQCLIRNGLFTKFPIPVDGLLAVHVAPDLAVGKVRLRSGIAFAHATLFHIKVKGIAGHGGAPYKGAIDSILLASRIVCALQSIVSRELSPLEEQAVISIGAMHGGDAGNAIPKEVILKGTTRCFSEAVFEKVKAAIQRICNGEASAAGLSQEQYPEVNFDPTYAQQLYNDPSLGAHLKTIYTSVLGEPAIEIASQPVTFGEDFAAYHLLSPDKKVPIFMTWLGSVNPAKFDAAGIPIEILPPLHNGDFTPYWNENAEMDTFRVGVMTQTCALLALFRDK